MSTINDDAQGKPGGGDAGKPGDDTTGKPGAGGSTGAGGQASGGAAETPKTYTEDDLRAAEERGRKAVLADAKKKEDEGKLSAEERERRRADEAETRLRERDARDLLEAGAKEAGASNPTKVYRLIKDELEFDDKGKPTNLKEVVAKAKRDFPDEFGVKRPPGSADGAAGRSSGTARTMNDLIRGKR
ncbi:MAG: hypothetical protein ABW208_07180 [Pyrinomonadaceae bacterium]